jgi:hypothetical protein
VRGGGGVVGNRNGRTCSTATNTRKHWTSSAPQIIRYQVPYLLISRFGALDNGC